MISNPIKTKIYAHRGASAYRPENTLDAFALAVEQGADGIELDVHLSKDGRVVVAHDAALERVSDGKGLINGHTLGELKQMDFSKLFPGRGVCRVPALEEVYELLRQTDVTVNVELKTTELLYPELPGLLIGLEREHNMTGRVIYSSFNHYSLAALKSIDPGARIGLLYELGLVDPWVYANYLSAAAIHPHYFVVAALPDTVSKCHEHGVEVNVWTADDEGAIRLMYKHGVDAVITNRPDIALNCRDETNQK